MARKLELKTVSLDGAAANGAAPQRFGYGECLISMLRYSPNAGMSFDEVVRSVEALAPIQKALNDGAAEVTLSDEQWRTVRQKLDSFQFGLADQAVVDFGLMIRNAPEIGA
jgi:hypothetical protein